jgi:hypothetical protein
VQDNQEENPLPSEEGSESSRQGSEQNLLVEEGVSVNREQEESSSCSSRVNSGRSEWLKILSEAGGLDVNILCPQSRSLLESTEAPVANRLDSRQSILQQIVPQLVEHEKNNVVLLEKNHQRAKSRASYGTLFLIIAVALFGLGIILIPAIVSSIIIPFIPVFLLGVAVSALGRIFLKLHENYCDTEYRRAKDVLESIGALQKTLVELKDMPIHQSLSEPIQEIAKDVKEVKEMLQVVSANSIACNGLFKSADRAKVTASDTTIHPMPGPSNAL